MATTTTESAYFALTARELRDLLYDIDNQEMTVKELRARLYYIDNDKAMSALSGIDAINREDAAEKRSAK